MVRIGIPLKYSHLKDGRCILYLGEKIRRCFQSAGALIIPIVQVQDVDYCDTKYNEFDKLSDLEKEAIEKYLDMVDGVVFPGGNKITPFDKYLLERCVDRDIPTLGICLGMQLMSCYKEDFQVFKIDSSINHFQESDDILTHEVNINKDSLLYRILGVEKLKVNSFHKYHISENENFNNIAFSEDGFIEGIEMSDKKFIIGIQWHPEISYKFDENSKKIINYFINICKE
jgi:putative glutamine amidotransferase